MKEHCILESNTKAAGKIFTLTGEASSLTVNQNDSPNATYNLSPVSCIFSPLKGEN